MDKTDNLLLSFTIDKGSFMCFGNVDVWKQAQMDDVNCPVIELSNVTAKRLDDNCVAVDYIPTGTNWNGVKYTTEDMVTSVLFEYLTGTIRKRQITYICPKLEEVLDFYKKQRILDVKPDISVLDNWPLRLLKDGDQVFSLMMLTNSYAYYSLDDSFLMFLPESLSERKMVLLADNHFAETGFADSVQNILTGDEDLLYLAPGVDLNDYE